MLDNEEVAGVKALLNTQQLRVVCTQQQQPPWQHCQLLLMHSL